MEDCTTVEGNADMYGLGIRLGFYIAWLAYLLAKFVAEEEAQAINYANFCFVSASVVSVVLQITRRAVAYLDIYVTLFFCLGYYLNLIPTLSSWLITRSGEIPTSTHSYRQHVTSSLIMLAIVLFSVFSIHWSLQAIDNIGEPVNCQPRMPLGHLSIFSGQNGISKVIISIMIFLVFLKLFTYTVTPHHATFLVRLHTERMQYRNIGIQAGAHIPPEISLNTMYTIIRLIHAGFIAIIIEVIIHQNNITGVDDIGTISQLVPFLVGLGVMGRVLYVAAFSVSGEPKPSHELATMLAPLVQPFRAILNRLRSS